MGDDAYILDQKTLFRRNSISFQEEEETIKKMTKDFDTDSCDSLEQIMPLTWHDNYAKSLIENDHLELFIEYINLIRDKYNAFEFVFYKILPDSKFVEIYSYAISKGRIRFVNFLLTEEIVDVNDRYNDINTLYLAYQKQEMSLYLLNRGIDVNQDDNYQIFLKHCIDGDFVFFAKYLKGCRLTSLVTYSLNNDIIRGDKIFLKGSKITEIVEKVNDDRMCHFLEEYMRSKNNAQRKK